MHLNNEEIQNNIDEFVEEHGVEGFFRLYLREYLFELLNEEINAASGDVESDSALQLHFSQNVTTDKELEEFEEQLREQCATRADELVERIKDSEELRPLFEEAEVELLQREDVEDMIENSMHDIIEEWEDDDN
jgi:urease gamma subunit